MERTAFSTGASNYARSGAVAGVVSALAFTVIHDVLISDIWFAALIMMIAGALCGLCIGWSYSRLVDKPSIGSWLGYNLLYVAMLMLLGTASVIFFDPIVSMTVLMASNGPPDDLIRQALPMTLVFTLAASIAISLFYKRSWQNFGTILLTSTVLILLLGLNVSALGLVSIPQRELYLVAEFLGLIMLINVVFVLVFLALEGKSLMGRSRDFQLEQGT